MGDERETQQPSLALGSASAVLGPDRGKFTGVSTGGAMANGGGHDRLAVASGTSRLGTAPGVACYRLSTKAI